MYEGLYRLPTLGLRNTKWALLWLGVICSFALIRPLVLEGLSGVLEIAGTLAISALLWLATPYLLLGRRLRWRRLAPAAVLSTIGMTGVGVWSVLFMPQIVASSSQEFGVIGIGFALLSWLVAVAIVLVVAASGGALIADRYDDRLGAHSQLAARRRRGDPRGAVRGGHQDHPARGGCTPARTHGSGTGGR
jgi:membrane protein